MDLQLPPTAALMEKATARGGWGGLAGLAAFQFQHQAQAQAGL